MYYSFSYSRYYYTLLLYTNFIHAYRYICHSPTRAIQAPSETQACYQQAHGRHSGPCH